MTSQRRGVLRARAALRTAACAVALVGGLGGGVAAAGEFEVRSCQASASRSVAAWSPVSPSIYVSGPFDWCAPGGGHEYNGMDMRESLALHTRFGSPSQLVGVGRWGATRFQAPPASAMTRVRFQRRLKVYDTQWVPKLEADGVEIDACRPEVSSYSCSEMDQPEVVKDVTLADADELVIALDCEVANCFDGSTVGPQAMAALYSSIVTVREEVAPSVSAVELVAGADGWAGPGSALRLAGSDTLGLRRLELLHEGEVVGAVNGSCVDWSVRPCAEPSAGGATSLTGEVAVTGLAVPDGEVPLSVRAVDAAGNTATSGPVVVRIDRAVPYPTTLRSTWEGDLRQVTWQYDRAPLLGQVAQICVGTNPDALPCREETLPPQARSLQVAFGDGLHGRVRISMTNMFGRSGYEEATIPFRWPATPPQPDRVVDPVPEQPQLRPAKLTLAAARKAGRRLRLTGNATPGAATRVTVKLTAPRAPGWRWTRTLRLTPTKRTGRFATTITIPTSVRAGTRIRVAATSSPAPGWSPATRTRTLRR